MYVRPRICSPCKLSSKFFQFNDNNTRRYIFRIEKQHINKSLRLNSFPARCINDMNDLPEEIVYFKETFEQIKEAIDECSFVAIDGEFTGLNHSRLSPIAVYDTPEERHYKTVQGVCDFLLIQFGLCTFSYNGNTKQYTAKPFNFYVFPRPHSRAAPDVRFSCQGSSLDFLLSQGFDFNKWIGEGIPYLTPDVESGLIEAAQKRNEMFMSPKLMASGGSHPGVVKGPVIIPSEHKEFIDKICDKVAKFIESGEEEELALPSCTAFQRKLTYQMLEYKYSSDVYLQSKTGEKKERYILVTKLKGEDDLRKLEEAKLAQELTEIDNAVGFTKVIKHLSQSGKLVIGHNMHLDVVHTIHQFLYQLPQEYQEFKILCQSVFPRLIDTKLMANTQPFKDRIEGSTLGQLIEITQRSPFDKPEVELGEGFDNRYKDNEILHEAGYDAYITGQCFISLANYLGKCHSPPIDRVPPGSPLLIPFQNKIFMMRSPDIPYMDLAGPDLSPSRDHVFHLSFPPEWRYDNIAKLFSGFGSFHVDWIDDVSVFIVLSSQSDIDRVLKTLCKKGSAYEIMSFQTYREMLKTNLLGESTESHESLPLDNSETNHGDAPSSPTHVSQYKNKRPHSPPGSDEKAKKLKPLNVDAPVFESRITPNSTPEKDIELNWSDDKQQNKQGAKQQTSFKRPQNYHNYKKGNVFKKNKKSTKKNKKSAAKQPDFKFNDADFPPL